ncbi:MAG: hypothetical protein ACHQ5A_05120 [Opitutales bacterium]
MNEFEQNLRKLPLTAPSANLDRRMQDTLATVAPTRPALRRVRLGWWFAALTATGAGAVWLLVSPPPPAPTPAPVEYRFEASGRLCRLLLDPPASAQRPPRFFNNSLTP